MLLAALKRPVLAFEVVSHSAARHYLKQRATTMILIIQRNSTISN
jgi:hypothetical protein